MTAQIPDTLLFEDQALSIVGVNGSGLFDPYVLNLQPVSRITSCWRGYVCEYKLLHNKLLLNKLQINLGMDEWKDKTHEFTPEAGPLINGVKPVFSIERQELFNNTYAELNLPIDFTGGLLAAGNFVQELYVHMGFHPAWKYKTVLELILSHGYVIETRDVSKRMEEIRNEMVNSPLEPNVNATKEQTEEWIASTFKLNYFL